ncbi:MAG: G8 domain-containing protein, partial [Dehalococcoidia bacterium]
MKRLKNAVFIAFALAIGIIFAISQGNSHTTAALAAGTISSAQSGNWSEASTWTGGTVPRAGDNVTINTGHTVNYNILSNNVHGELVVSGTLRFSRTTDTRLKLSGNIRIMMDGELDMGNAEDPIPASTRTEVIFVFPEGYRFTGGSTFKAEDKGIWAMNGTKWTTHGAPLLHTWSKLAQTASSGSSTVVVKNDVTGWYDGGSVVITQTTNPFRPGTFGWEHCQSKFGDEKYAPEPEKRCNYFWENETRTITHLELLPDGTTRITLDRPLDFTHHSIEHIQGEVGLLTRNVLIRTEIQGVSDSQLDQQGARRRFAHTMLMGTGRGTIQYTEFKYMGHVSTLARYPIHMHMTHSSGEGVVLRGNSVWRSGNRGYQIHNTNGVLIEDNVSFDTVMSPFYIERTGHPGETISKTDPEKTPYNNWFVRNLGVQASKAPGKGQAQQNDDSIYWIDNLDNLFFGNVGVGAGANGGTGAFVKDAQRDFTEFTGTGMWFDDRSAGTGRLQRPYFFKNEMHSNGIDGIAFWPQGVDPFEFIDFATSRNGQDGVRWGYYRAPHKLFQILAYENGDDGIGSDRHNRSGTRYVVDAKLIGNRVGIMNGPDVVRPIYPDYPYTYFRPVFEDNKVAGIANYLRNPGGDCTSYKDTPIIDRTCHASYVLMADADFRSGKPIDMVDGWEATATGGNKNNLWRIKDSKGLPSSFPDDFFLMRPDQIIPSSQTDFSRMFLTGTGIRLANELNNEALVVPVAPLPDSINPPTWGSSGANSGSPKIGRTYYYTWQKNVDVPPEVSINVELSGKTATVNATASDDHGVTKVEFYLDNTLISTDSSAPYQATIDLSEHPRNYGYIYAAAYDGHIFRHTTAALGDWDSNGPDSN